MAMNGHRFKPYPAYKDSGVEWLGEIPAHWESLALKRIVDPTRPVTYGIVQCGPDYPEGVPYIRPVDMGDEGGVRVEVLQRTAPEIAAAYARSTSIATSASRKRPRATMSSTCSTALGGISG